MDGLTQVIIVLIVIVLLLIYGILNFYFFYKKYGLSHIWDGLGWWNHLEWEGMKYAITLIAVLPFLVYFLSVVFLHLPEIIGVLLAILSEIAYIYSLYKFYNWYQRNK